MSVQTEVSKDWSEIMMELVNMLGPIGIDYLPKGFQLRRLNYKKVLGWDLDKVKSARKFLLDKLGIFASFPKRGKGLKKSYVLYFSYTQKPYIPDVNEVSSFT